MLKFVYRVLIVFVLAIIVGAALLFFTAPNRFNILVIGTDQRGEERSRSDVLFIFSLAKLPSQKSALITIPRDSRVDIPGYGDDKVTHAYVYGDNEDSSSLGNRKLTTETVENALDVRIDGTVEVTFDSFVSIVDSLGGVDLESAGHLDGEDALAQVRDRYRAGGDFARTADQRELFRALLTKVKSKQNAQMLYTLVQENDDVRVKISLRRFGHFAIAFWAARGGQLSIGEVHDEALPGHGETQYAPSFGQNLYFWILDEEATDELADTYLR